MAGDLNLDAAVAAGADAIDGFLDPEWTERIARLVIVAALPHILEAAAQKIDTKLVSCDCSCGDNAKAEAIAIVRGSVETAPETGPGAPWGDKHPTNEAQSETGVRNASGSSQGDSGSAAIRTNITAVAIAIIGTGLVTGAILLLARRTS